MRENENARAATQKESQCNKNVQNICKKVLSHCLEASFLASSREGLVESSQAREGERKDACISRPLSQKKSAIVEADSVIERGEVALMSAEKTSHRTSLAEPVRSRRMSTLSEMQNAFNASSHTQFFPKHRDQRVGDSVNSVLTKGCAVRAKVARTTGAGVATGTSALCHMAGPGKRKLALFRNYDENEPILQIKGLSGTAQCYVMNPVTRQMKKVRVLLDSGANVTAINRVTARAVGLKGQSVRFSLGTAGGGTVCTDEKEVVFRLVQPSRDFISLPVVAVTQEVVGNPYEPIAFNPKNHAHLKGLELADTFPDSKEKDFQILLGEPYYSYFEKPGRAYPLDRALPIAVDTQLGWVLRGAEGILRQIPSASMYGAIAKEHEVFDLETVYKSVGFDFSKFWTGENVGLNPKESMQSDFTALEIQALEHQRSTAKLDPVAKKWSVCLPWIDPDPKSHRLTDNMSRAVAMWHKIMRSVKPEHMPFVEKAYEELIENGSAELVPEGEIYPSHPTYVMTSRPVFRWDKATTKCRIVCNASLADQKDATRSLNKLLMPGPNMLPQIMTLILKTMTKKHLVLVDIKKMFLAILLEKLSDQDMLRFVWAKPGSTHPQLYRMLVIIFGVLSSPFQAMWCLRETADLLQDQLPEAARIIRELSYMDDITILANSIKQISQLLKDVLAILEAGGFFGHKISASDPKILEFLDPERVDSSKIISVLGLKLDHNTGEFMFDLDEKFKRFDANAERITSCLLYTSPSPRD